MYGCEIWSIKKAEHQRIGAFELWCWIRLLRVPWTARREIQPVNPKGNQSWIFIGRTDVEGEMPILWLPDMKNLLIWKDPDAGKDWRFGGEGDDRGWDGWMASPNQWTWAWVDFRSWWWTRMPGLLQSIGLQRVGHDWVTEVNCTLTTLSDNIKYWEGINQWRYTHFFHTYTHLYTIYGTEDLSRSFIR